MKRIEAAQMWGGGETCQIWQNKNRLVRRGFLLASGRVASSTRRPPPSGEPVAVALSGRWAIALILKPVPNVSADIGRLDDFW